MNGLEKKKTEATDVERIEDRPHFNPYMEIFETDEGLTLLADMPGVPKEGLEVTVDDGVLQLRGESRLDLPEAEAVYREFDTGIFHRSFVLPDEIDPEKIEASLDDGVLTVRLPKAERARTRRIELS